MRVLVVGAGVIGSVYAGKLVEAGHEAVMLCRGERLADLQGHGLVLQDAESKQQTRLRVPAVGVLDPADRYDLVLVSVRKTQVAAALPLLTEIQDRSDVLFFGNSAGCGDQLVQALGDRAVFGFPAVGGTRNGSVISYVLIRKQKTMLGEPNGEMSLRVPALQHALDDAGFPTRVSADISCWLIAHAAFIVPIAFALYRAGTDPARLARDHKALAQMVRATRQAFRGLRASGNAEIPTNLRGPLPAHAGGVCRALLAARARRSRGELWFAAHSRHAPEEMASLRDDLQAAVRKAGRPTPDLDALLARS